MADIDITAYWESAPGTPLTSPANVPTIRVRRLDTDALVVTDVVMVEVGDGNYKYTFTPPVNGLYYSARADGDPTAAGQVPAGIRYTAGSLYAPATDLEYEGAVWVDTTGAGTAGTAFPIGTRGMPVSNPADARTIADAIGTRSMMLTGLFTCDQSYVGFTFAAVQGGGSVNANGQDCGASIFNEVGITGTFNSTADMFGTAMSFFGTTTNWRGTAVRPGFSGTIVCAPGQVSTFAQAASIVAGVSTPAISVAGVGTQLNLRAYSGGMRITDMNNATSNASLEFTAGQLIMDNSNTAGVIVIRGILSPITDNTTGTTVINDGAVQGVHLDDIWQNEGLDPDNPKTIEEITEGSDYDEDVGSIHKDVTKVGTTTTIDRT